jgi:hypothetical protein
MNLRRLVLAALVVFSIATVAQAQAVLVSPTSVRVTTNEPPLITTFHLALYPVGSIPSATTLTAAVDVVAPAPSPAGTYLISLSTLLTAIGPPFRSTPLTLFVSATNAAGTSTPIAAGGSLQVNPILVLPNAPLTATLVQ